MKAGLLPTGRGPAPHYTNAVTTTHAFRSTPDDSGPERRRQSGLYARFVGLAGLALAFWLAFASPIAASGAARASQLVSLGALGLCAAALASYLAASAPRRSSRATTRLVRLGTLSTTVAFLMLAAVALLALIAPPLERNVSIQFSDISGRVQLEFCPDLPSSFDAFVRSSELASSSTLLPVRVTRSTCGSPAESTSVWLYLNRSSITVADTGIR